MTELRKKVALKIAVGTVFICIFILALMYPVISVGHREKIYFLMSPNPHAVFDPPAGKGADVMAIGVAVVKDSTYGSFTSVVVGYETYYNDYDYYEYHLYTDNLRAAEMQKHLMMSVYPTTKEGKAIEWLCDITLARIHVEASEHQLNATVKVHGNKLFEVGFWAEANTPIESRIEPWSPLPPETYLSVEAYRPLQEALVTGIEVGDRTGGRFEYMDTELYDSSLLP